MRILPFFWILVVIAPVIGQSNLWPLYFIPPLQQQEQSDSTTFRVSGNAKMFENYKKAQTTLE